MRRLNELAILIVAVGATTGLAAVAYVWFARGQFAETTFFASLFAMSLAQPVIRDYMAMRRTPRTCNRS